MSAGGHKECTCGRTTSGGVVCPTHGSNEDKDSSMKFTLGMIDGALPKKKEDRPFDEPQVMSMTRFYNQAIDTMSKVEFEINATAIEKILNDMEYDRVKSGMASTPTIIAQSISAKLPELIRVVKKGKNET